MELSALQPSLHGSLCRTDKRLCHPTHTKAQGHMGQEETAFPGAEGAHPRTPPDAHQAITRPGGHSTLCPSTRTRRFSRTLGPSSPSPSIDSSTGLDSTCFLSAQSRPVAAGRSPPHYVESVGESPRRWLTSSTTATKTWGWRGNGTMPSWRGSYGLTPNTWGR